MIDAGLVGTLGFGVGAGLATFFAPCAYPLLPGYVGYAVRETTGVGGAALRGVAASLGAVVVLAGVGGLLLTAGRRLAEHLPLLEPVVGVALIGLGVLTLTDRAPTVSLRLPERRTSVVGCAVFGGGYALAAAGCVVPVVLGVVAQSLALEPGGAAVVLGGYVVAAAAPLTGVTLLAAVGGDVLRSRRVPAGSIERLAGVAMVLAGVAQVVVSLRYVGLL